MYLSRRILTVAAATFFALPAFTQTNFQYQPYAAPNGGSASLAAPNTKFADFNGDGRADVLVVNTYYVCSGNSSGETCNERIGLDLYLNNGSGGMGAPQALNVFGSQPAPVGYPLNVAVADFNGDGKLDIAVLVGNGQMSMLYGNGDGTFAAPVLSALPAGTYNSMAAADFDANGTQDLAALNENGQLVLLFNNGKGSFTQQTVTIDTPPSGYTNNVLAVGDFNGDGRPDIAFDEEGNENYQNNTLWASLNTGKGVFSAKKELGTTSPGFQNLIAADLDLDGKTDLVAWTTQLSENCCSQFPETLFYSNGDGTFTSKVLTSMSASGMGVADINGDGNPDVLITNTQGVEVFTGSGNRNFTDAGTYTSLPGGAAALGFGFFTGSNAVGFTTPNGGGDGTMTSANDGWYLVANDNAQGNCPYPTSAGVSFCSTQSGNTAQVRGTARAQTQPVREIELWANGKELYKVESDEFNATLNVAPGTQITATEVEANGATRSATVTPTSTGTCAAPSSPGVNVCSPSQGATVSSPVTITAAGTGASGTVNHLELWVDGNKLGVYSGATMNASVPLAAGSAHGITVIEVDSKGAYVKSNIVDVTVGSSTGACAAPSSPGVNVCSPSQGATVSSPVTITAAGTGASGSVNHLELWIDGNKFGVYSGATMDASVALASGSHGITVIEVDSKGAYVKSSVINVTVGSSTGACAAPSSPGVNVCSPSRGATVSSPVTISAAGKGASGTVNHLELWIDGRKIGVYSGATMDSAVTLAAGSHAITVIEVDSTGAYVKSNVVNVTVK